MKTTRAWNQLNQMISILYRSILISNYYHTKVYITVGNWKTPCDGIVNCCPLTYSALKSGSEQFTIYLQYFTIFTSVVLMLFNVNSKFCEKPITPCWLHSVKHACVNYIIRISSRSLLNWLTCYLPSRCKRNKWKSNCRHPYPWRTFFYDADVDYASTEVFFFFYLVKNRKYW